MEALHSVAGFILAAAMATPAVADPLAMDSPIQINALETVCTGIGSAKDDPRWSSYPIRIEFSNGGAQYLSGAHVTLSERGRTVADFDCAGAWVLVKGKPGNYHVSATIDGSSTKPANASFALRTGTQKRVVLRFPDFQANQ
jgi:hypothetical protein